MYAFKSLDSAVNALVFRSLENLERPLRDAKRVQTATQLIWGEEDQVSRVEDVRVVERVFGRVM